MNLKYRTAEIFRENSLIFYSQGKLGAKEVQRDYDVRPNPPAFVQTRCKWIIGDVTEVLDCNTWKLGKIAKMLKNNYFVIRLADCVQLKEFHISSLRVPLPHAPAAPHSKQFPAAEKATERVKRLPTDRNFPRSKVVLGRVHQAYEGRGHMMLLVIQ